MDLHLLRRLYVTGLSVEYSLIAKSRYSNHNISNSWFMLNPNQALQYGLSPPVTYQDIFHCWVNTPPTSPGDFSKRLSPWLRAETVVRWGKSVVKEWFVVNFDECGRQLKAGRLIDKWHNLQSQINHRPGNRSGQRLNIRRNIKVQYICTLTN